MSEDSSSNERCPHGISLTANPPCHFCEHAREIERLTRENAELRHDIERAIANHTADLSDEMTSCDAKRLLWISTEIDQFGKIDIHEQAAIYASAFGREEPNDDDYLAATRDAIDDAMRSELVEKAAADALRTDDDPLKPPPCAACDGAPSPDNSPCAVCGRSASTRLP